MSYSSSSWSGRRGSTISRTWSATVTSAAPPLLELVVSRGPGPPPRHTKGVGLAHAFLGGIERNGRGSISTGRATTVRTGALPRRVGGPAASGLLPPFGGQ